MAHKVESMAYSREEAPWHGLGTAVDPDTGVDDMIEAAGLGWGVGLSEVRYYTPGDGAPPRQRTANGRFVLHRTDTGEALDIVGNRWEPVQNRDVFEFFREYVEAGDATLETAGSLDGGRMVWALAKMGESFTLPGDDRVEGYVLLANPHQYRKSLTIKSTNVRVVCWNTITRALRSKGSRSVRLWHNRKFDKSVQDEAKRRLGIARERFDAFAEVAESLANLTLDDEDAARIAAELMGNSEPTAPIEEQSRTTRRIFDLYKGEGRGSNLPSARGTGWGLLNAFTEYRDHHYGHNANNRIRNAWFGSGETLKRKATKRLLSLT